MNKKQHLNESGVAHLVTILVVVLVVGIVGFAGYRVMNSSKDTPSNAQTTKKSSDEVAATVWPMDKGITWEATGQGSWITLPYDKTPPTCPDPLTLKLPTTDIAKATSILYPGQNRMGTFEGLGGTYKPHGGIRFDKATDNNISVVMPFDGYVMRGTQFLVDGEIQYGFDIVNPCGTMIRLGHLRDLTPAFQSIADKFPAAKEGDSRTEKVLPMIPFKTGDKIATAVGFKTTKNVGFDYGVYDLKNDNEATKDAAYKTAHAGTAELSSHALCWLDHLNASDTKIVKALPAGDSQSGSKSDYCK